MKLQQIDDVMERLARLDVTVILKVDHERMAEGGRPWTVVFMGPAIGESAIRAEKRTLDDCLAEALGRLRETGAQWDWLSVYGEGELT